MSTVNAVSKRLSRIFGRAVLRGADTNCPPENREHVHMPTMPKLSRLSAKQELEVLKRYPSLLPGLLRCGLEAQDAIALAGNVCMVWVALGAERPKAPGNVLEHFSLSEIAALCEELEKLARTEVAQ